jgi:hypothetical protein
VRVGKRSAWGFYDDLTMKAIQPIQRFYLLSAALLVTLWFLADPAWWGRSNFFVWRASYTCAKRRVNMSLA